MAVMVSGKGVFVYRLNPGGAEQVTTHAMNFRACSAATDGKRVYALASGSGVCLDVETGEALWHNKGNNDTYASSTVADGKIICNHRRGLILYDAGTGKELGRAPIAFAACTTAGLVGGRLLARSGDRLTCYDLRKP
jgi:outer membrane protein assembly factor BamB